MNTSYILKAVIVILSFLCETISIKVWKKDNSRLNDILKVQKCAIDKLIFPENYFSITELEGKNDIKIGGVFLPNDGAIVLGSDMQITFEDRKNSPDCFEDLKVASKDDKLKYWFDPTNWQDISSKTDQSIVPHMERIPCDHDTVVINSLDNLAIDLEDVGELNIGKVILDGHEASETYMQNFIHSELGELAFLSFATTFRYHPDPNYCVCHVAERYIQYFNHVCEHVNSTCPKSSCLNPVLPMGHCCHICGSILTLKFDYDDGCQKSFSKVRAVIEEVTSQNSYPVNTYTSVYDTGLYLQLQVIATDKDAGRRDHVKFINVLNNTILQIPEIPHKIPRTVSSSGIPYNPNPLLSGWLLPITTFLVVMLFFLSVYIYYVPEYNVLPSWASRGRYSAQPPRLTFRRFDNIQQQLIEEPEEVIDQSNDNNCEVTGNEHVNNAFDNPMFSEEGRCSGAQDINDSVSCFSKLKEEELTEIDLVSLKGE